MLVSVGMCWYTAVRKAMRARRCMPSVLGRAPGVCLHACIGLKLTTCKHPPALHFPLRTDACMRAATCDRPKRPAGVQRSRRLAHACGGATATGVICSLDAVSCGLDRSVGS